MAAGIPTAGNGVLRGSGDGLTMNRRLRIALLLVVPVSMVAFIATSAAWLGMMLVLTEAQRQRWVFGHATVAVAIYWCITVLMALAVTWWLARYLASRRPRTAASPDINES